MSNFFSVLWVLCGVYVGTTSHEAFTTDSDGVDFIFMTFFGAASLGVLYAIDLAFGAIGTIKELVVHKWKSRN